ncbi:hypothetical protein [Streptomyces sp. NPDC000229]|uniref:hypothetical protein n=1 Tax=Streptomyces sp. NPDC000229 TaxID=3154247 RepID=UPI004037DD9D
MAGCGVLGVEAGGFGSPEQWRFDWEWSYTRDAWLDQMPTRCLHPTPAGQAGAGPDRRRAAIDAMGGTFTMRYATMVVTAARTGSAA